MKYKVSAVYRGLVEAYRISHVSNGIRVKASIVEKYANSWNPYFYDVEVAQEVCNRMNKDFETKQFNKKLKEYL